MARLTFRKGPARRLRALIALFTLICGMVPGTFGAGRANAAPAPPVYLTAGRYYALAVSPEGTLWRWGSFSEDSWANPGPTYPERFGSQTGIVAVARAQRYWSSTDQRTIALKSDGTVWQNRTVDGEYYWWKVAGLSGITAVAAGQQHYVTLKSDGTVWTWGFGSEGQLGDGKSVGYRDTPEQVPNLTGVRSIVAAGMNTLVVKDDGTVWGWGVNVNGQLGDGTTQRRTTPVQAQNLTDVMEVSLAGWSGGHALARTADGQVWAWGSRGNGELGLGPETPTESVLTPRAVPGMTDAISISAAGTKSLAVRRDGSVWRWGSGLDMPNAIVSPEQVAGLPAMVSVVAAPTAAYAQTATGELWSWGVNVKGELGQELPTPPAGTPPPGEVFPPGKVLPVKADTQKPTWPAGAAVQIEQVTATSAVLSWTAAEDDIAVKRYTGSCTGGGYLDFSQNSPTKASVGFLRPSTTYTCSVIASDRFGNQSDPLTATFATTADLYPPTWVKGGGLGAHTLTNSTLTLVWSGARDDIGVAGYQVLQDGEAIGTTAASGTTLAVTDLQPDTDYTFQVQARDANGNWSADGPTLLARTGVTNPRVQLSAHWGYAVAVGPDGSVIWWGDRAPVSGDSTANRPQPLPGLAGVRAAAASMMGVAVQRHDGSVWWIEPGAAPKQMSGVDGAVALAGGWGHILALMPDGTVWGWGSGAAGQLGGTQEDRPEPVQIAGLSNVTAIAAASGTSIALLADGTVWQLGCVLGTDANTYPRALSPVKVGGLANITAISAQGSFALALDKNGKVWAWGTNEGGTLGDGTETDRPTAVAVRNLTGVTTIAAGDAHSLAIKADGTVWTWGLTPADSATPKQVTGLTGARAAGGGYMYSLVLDQNGDIWSWGNAGPDVLGRGSDPQNPDKPGKVLLPWSDTEAPVWPGGATLEATNVVATRLTLTWPAAQDNRAVTGYRVLRNGAVLTTLAGKQTTYNVTGLSATTAYTFQVQAGDAIGNWTTNGPTVTVTTPAVDKTAPALLKNDAGIPALVLMSKRGTAPWVQINPTITKTGISFTTDTADLYVLLGIVSEPLSGLLVNGKAASFEMDGLTFATMLQPTGNATDSFKVEATDPSGNKGLLANASVTYVFGPALTVSEPTATTVYTKSNVVTIKGTTSRFLAAIVAEKADDPTQRYEIDYTTDEKATSFNATVTLPAEPGTYKLRMVAYDINGNRGLPDKNGKDIRTFVYDPVAPAPPQFTSPVVTDGVAFTNLSALTLTGKTEANAVVKLTAGTASYQATASANGDWTFKNVSLPAGETQLTVKATDLAGNVSEPVSVRVISDKLAPALDSAVLRNAAGDEAATVTVKGTDLSTGVTVPGTYTFVLTFKEPLTSAQITDRAPAPAQASLAGDAVVRVTVSNLKEGATTPFKLQVKDRAGNATVISGGIRLDSLAPSITVTGSVRSWTIGLPPNQPRGTVTISGSSGEALSTVRLAPVSGSDISELELTAKIDGRDPKKWTAAVSVPGTAPATWQFALVTVDLAGNVSTTPSPALTVTIDPTRPVLALKKEFPGVLYTGASNTDWGVAAGKLKLEGTVTDETAVKQAVVGTQQKVDAARGKSFDFASEVALTEGKLTTVTVYGEDMVGNRSEAVTVNAVLKTKLALSKTAATWTSSAKSLKVTGTVDAALKIGDQWSVVVPVKIVVKQGETEVYTTTLTEGSTGYNVANGAFSVVIPGQTWAKGTYTVTVTAQAPAEFAQLPEVFKTLSFTIR